MTNKASFPGAGEAKQQALAAARDRADNTRPLAYNCRPTKRTS